MDNNDQFGDFTVLDEIASKLTGGFNSNVSETSFPIMDIRENDEDLIDFSTENSGGFNDERKATTEDIDEDEGVELSDDDTEEDEPSDAELDKDKVDSQSDSEDESGSEEEDTQEKTDNIISDLGEDELEITAFVQEKLFDKLGWEITDEDKFDSIEGLVDYMEKIVEANSKPEFANKDMESLNSFVKDGGNLKDFFDIQGEVDIDKLDLNVEYNQKLVIKESLKDRGYSDAQADKKIQRYDESGILEDEAVEAKEYVEKIRKDKAETLLKNQKVIQKQREAEQQKFYNDVNSSIDSLKDVRGLPVTNALRNKLKDSLLKVGPDGQTDYQKKYNENLIKNMLESAYFTITGDTLVKDLTKRAESQATKNLKKKLETRTKKGRVSGSLDAQTTDTSHKALDIFNNFIKP